MLRGLRKDMGLSVFKAAKHLHISGNYLSQIERGEKIPSEAVLHSIASFYQLDEDDLFLSYGKITNENIKNIMQIPDLIKIMTKLSTDKTIKPSDIEHISNELLSVYQKLNDKEESK